MTDHRDPPLSPFHLLIRFILVTSASFLAWQGLAPFYLSTLLPFLNRLLAWEGIPFLLEIRDRLLLVSGRMEDGLPRHFLLTGHESTGLWVLGAVSLFVATPGRGLRWKADWIAGTASILWVLDLCILYAGLHAALAQHSISFPTAQAFFAINGFLGARSFSWDRAIGLWSAWGTPALLFLLWFRAIRGHRVS